MGRLLGMLGAGLFGKVRWVVEAGPHLCQAELEERASHLEEEAKAARQRENSAARRDVEREMVKAQFRGERGGY